MSQERFQGTPIVDERVEHTYSEAERLAALVIKRHAEGTEPKKKDELVAAATALIAAGQKQGLLSGDDMQFWASQIEKSTKAEIADDSLEIADEVNEVTSRENKANYQADKRMKFGERNAATLADLQVKLNEQAEKLKRDPAHVLEWGERLFELAAEIDVRNIFAYYIKKNAEKDEAERSTLQELTARFAERVQADLHSCLSTTSFRSTSMSHNLMQEHKRVALALIAGQLKSAGYEVEIETRWW